MCANCVTPTIRNYTNYHGNQIIIVLSHDLFETLCLNPKVKAIKMDVELPGANVREALMTIQIV